MTTLLISGESFAAESVTVDGEPFRHLFRARRLGPGERLRVVDGNGAARWATVGSVGRRSAELELGAAAPDNEPPIRLEVWVAPPRSNRAPWMIEKLTELGVRAVHLWTTERGPRRYGAARLERLRRVAAAALEQCERSRLPLIDACSWDEGIAGIRRCGRRWLLQPGAPPPETATRAGDDDSAVALLVGPEGGWDEAELELLVGLPCRLIGVGPTVLRVETAAVVGAALALTP